MILFTLFTPIGIGIGWILQSNGNRLMEGIILALSSGTFIYVACSEVIVEEFAVTKYKYMKFSMYFVGALLVAGLSVWEVYGGGHGGEDHDDHDDH